MALPLSSSELHGVSNPSVALHLSQQAPLFLQNQQSAAKPFPLSIFSAPETSDIWTNYEQLLLACLKTGDEKSAHLCLERLSERFGPTNERVMGLRGLYQEAVTEDKAGLETILQEYEKILEENPVNTPVIKRRVALLRSMGKSAEAIAALVEFIEASPTDAEAWCELADLYQSQGLSSQAIFSLEEALLITPNAWNLHARLGEVQYLAASSPHLDGSETGFQMLTDSIRRFCRSVELCDDYIRGYYGLKLATSRLLQSGSASSRTSEMPPTTVRDLNRLATKKLSHIVESRSNQGKGSDGVQGDVIAARELLDRDDGVQST